MPRGPFLLFGQVDGDQDSGFNRVAVDFPDVKVRFLTEKYLEAVLGTGQAESVFISVAIETAGIEDDQLVIVVFEIGDEGSIPSPATSSRGNSTEKQDHLQQTNYTFRKERNNEQRSRHLYNAETVLEAGRDRKSRLRL